MRKWLNMMMVMILIFMAGCWDQELLVNKTIVNGVSFDIMEDGKIEGNVRALYIQSKGGGQFEIYDELVGSTQPTPISMAKEIDNKIAGEIEFGKANIILIGEELAKKGILSLIEPFYRTKDGYIASKIMITKGKAVDVLSTEKEKSPIAFVILKIITGAEKSSIIPKDTAFSVWKGLVDPGEDKIIPIVEKVESDKIAIGGVALFNGEKYTGTSLSDEKSTLLLLLLDELNKKSNLSVMLSEKNSISFNPNKLKRSFLVTVDKQNHKISSKIEIEMDIEVISYQRNIGKEINIDKVNKELSTELTKQAKEITNTLLRANCDAFGIGRKIASSYPNYWNKINWDQEYKKVEIEPKVKVNIIKTGDVY